MGHILDRRHFGDFEQYREELRCWDTEAIQLSPGPLTIAYDCFDAGDLILVRLDFEPGALFKSARHPGWYTFIVDSSPKRWCGIDVPAGSLRTIAPKRETNVISCMPWHSICIAVERDTLASWGPPLADVAAWEPDPEHSILQADRPAVNAFRSWVEALFARPVHPGGEDDALLWVAAIQAQIRQHLQAMVGHRRSPEAVSPVRRVARYDLVLAALRRIQPHAENRVSVKGLAAQLGVSPRALEYAFVGVIGISPARYLLAERLNRARHQLRISALSGGSVTSVAFDHQFEHLSRFAHQYTRLFGERPSDTLRVARTAMHQA